jgi:Short C-terminal domain
MVAHPGPVQTCRGGQPTEEGDVGLFFRPRRPLMRLAAGAATAGIAYHAGQRRAEQDAYNEQAAAAYEAGQAPPPPPPQPAYTPAPAAGPPPDTIAELERLARLHESGALTDQEFTAAKARALGILPGTGEEELC